MGLRAAITSEFVEASIMVKRLDHDEKVAMCAGIMRDLSASSDKDPEQIAQFVLTIIELGDKLRRE